MTTTELKKGEYETVEYKQDIPLDRTKYLKTAVAFANGAGGRLIFGVENNSWKILGFDAEDLFQKYDAIANSIFDACIPAVVPIMEIEEVDGERIIVANILPGMAKPYYLRKEGMLDGTYIRVAGVTRKAEPYMIKELQLEGTNTSFDTMQVLGEVDVAEIDSLCERMYQHALNLCKSDEQRRNQKRVTCSQLVSWKILVNFNGKFFPTNAYKLLTGDTEDLFPDAFIQLAAFKGNTRAIFLDKKEATGPIDLQIEDAMLFVKKHLNLGSRIEGIYREDYYELPIDSVREMISNAVCHRSYLSPGSIQVAIYDDRLEVTSPGRLCSGLTPELMMEGNSRVRNIAIGAAFQYMHIIEKWGSGIPRIFKDAKDYGLAVPEIKNFGSSIRMNLYRKPFEIDSFGVVSPSQIVKSQQENTTVSDSKNGKTIKTPAESAVKSADKPADSADKPADSADKPADLADKPTDSADKPTDSADKPTESAGKPADSKTALSKQQLKLLSFMETGKAYSANEVASLLGLKGSRTRELLKQLVDLNRILITAETKNRKYIKPEN